MKITKNRHVIISHQQPLIDEAAPVAPDNRPLPAGGIADVRRLLASVYPELARAQRADAQGGKTQTRKKPLPRA
jgi:hypothetical protein